MSKEFKYILIIFLALVFFTIIKPKGVNAAWVCRGATGCNYWQSSCTLCPNCLNPACWETTCTGFQSKNCTASCGPVNCGSGSCGRPTNSCYWDCSPDCGSQQCGTDSCGQSCGTCTGGRICNASYQCVLPPSCSATAPTNLSVTRVSPTSATLSWTPGANGTEQRIYVGANKTEVDASCPGTGSPACVVKVTGLPTSQTSYTTGDVLVSGTVYYWRVVNYKDASCSSGPASDATAVSSCALSPSSASLITGGTTTLTTSVNASAEIQEVRYTSSNTAVATVTTPDATSPYQTTVTAVSPGSTTATNNVIIGGVINCSDVSNVTVTSPGPWWQVKDSDLTTNGDITSKIPSSCTLPVCNPVLDIPGAGTYPGVPLYAGAFTIGSGTVSTKGWLANTSYLSSRTYDYRTLVKLIPADVTITEITSPSVPGATFTSGGTLSRGYYWYHFNGNSIPGDLTISSNINVPPGRKVVLLVEGADLNLSGKVNVGLGTSTFVVLVGKNTGGGKGGINISPTIGGGGGPHIEGMYFAEGAIHTGVAATALYIRGSMATNSGIVLERDLGAGNANTPGETFEYAPDQILLFPQKLSVRKMWWKEVAP